MATESPCVMCQRSRDPRIMKHVVYEGQHWFAAPSPEFAVQESLILQTRRHVEGIWGLTNKEAFELGPALHTLTAAIHSITAAPRVYAFAFGEGAAHCHFGLVPRGQDLPLAERGPAFLTKHLQKNPPFDADSLTSSSLREALRRRSGQ